MKKLLIVFLVIISTPLFSEELFAYKFNNQLDVSLNVIPQYKIEATTFYSAMIYGYSFKLEPKHFDRKIEQKFTINPSKYKIDDSNIEAYQTTIENNLHSIFIKYKLSKREETYYNNWKIRNTVRGKGNGDSPFYTGNKLEAYNSAIHNALVDTLKQNSNINKPQTVYGNFIIEEPPLFTYKSGHFIASVKIIVEVTKVKEFTFF